MAFRTTLTVANFPGKTASSVTGIGMTKNALVNGFAGGRFDHARPHDIDGVDDVGNISMEQPPLHGGDGGKGLCGDLAPPTDGADEVGNIAMLLAPLILFKIVPDETNSTSGDGGFVMAYHGKFPTPTIETGLLGKEMEREPPDKEPEVTTADWASLLL